MTDSDLKWQEDSYGRLKYKRFSMLVNDHLGSNMSNSWYQKFVHDEVILVME